jgi:hypothetical protein
MARKRRNIDNMGPAREIAELEANMRGLLEAEKANANYPSSRGALEDGDEPLSTKMKKLKALAALRARK